MLARLLGDERADFSTCVLLSFSFVFSRNFVDSGMDGMETWMKRRCMCGDHTALQRDEFQGVFWVSTINGDYGIFFLSHGWKREHATVRSDSILYSTL